MTKTRPLSVLGAQLIEQLRAIDTPDIARCPRLLWDVLGDATDALLNGGIGVRDMRAVNKESARILREIKARLSMMKGVPA